MGRSLWRPLIIELIGSAVGSEFRIDESSSVSCVTGRPVGRHPSTELTATGTASRGMSVGNEASKDESSSGTADAATVGMHPRAEVSCAGNAVIGASGCVCVGVGKICPGEPAGNRVGSGMSLSTELITPGRFVRGTFVGRPPKAEEIKSGKFVTPVSVGRPARTDEMTSGKSVMGRSVGSLAKTDNRRAYSLAYKVLEGKPVGRALSKDETTPGMSVSGLGITVGRHGSVACPSSVPE